MPQTDAEAPVRPDRAFERYVWQNHEICNNCFVRCQITYEATRERGVAVETVRETHRTPDGTLAQEAFDHDDYGALRTHEPRTTCAECGSVRLLTQRDTYSKAEMVTLAGRIANRLIEQDIACHIDATKRLAGRAKSKCDVQGRDREIFERAVAFGIQQARGTYRR